MPLKANFHTHTTFCDGENTAEEMLLRALELGFSHLGFSGHGYTWFDKDFLLDTDAYFRECRRLAEKYRDQIEVLVGIEQDNLADVSVNKDADYLIGSTHYLHFDDDSYIAIDNTAEMVADMVKRYFGGDYYRYSKAYYELEAQVYDRTHCDFIGHFDLVVRFNDQMHTIDETDARYLKPALEAMEYLVSKDIPFEINTGAINRGRKAEPYPTPRLLKALHDFGGQILINSDSHSVKTLDGCFDVAVQKARAAGFTHTNILTKEGWKQVALDRL